ncbi:MAG: class I SAM-dependent methyltransferase [Actinomycetota bacterium]|nr:class I SAM-dependent methyltransferase [Actinomycetota bacterium]
MHRYIATGSAPDREGFFRQGAEEADALLAFCGIEPSTEKTMLEIGCGVGRMTRRFSERYGSVVAVDVSPEMLARARENLADRSNVEWVLGSGSDLSPIADATIDHVFSYITLQHVPRQDAVLSYVRETSRVLRIGGEAGLQVRRPGWQAAVIDFAGHVGRAARGRPTLAAEWRGTRVPVASLLDAATVSGSRVELRPRGRRHLWLVMERVT